MVYCTILSQFNTKGSSHFSYSSNLIIRCDFINDTGIDFYFSNSTLSGERRNTSSFHDASKKLYGGETFSKFKFDKNNTTGTEVSARPMSCLLGVLKTLLFFCNPNDFNRSTNSTMLLFLRKVPVLIPFVLINRTKETICDLT